jgi:hypothetical protein
MTERIESIGILILEALEKAGGRAHLTDVLAYVERSLFGGLTAWDYALVGADRPEPRWRNKTRWTSDDLVKLGLMRRGSPRGFWEITEAGRRWLGKHRRRG